MVVKGEGPINPSLRRPLPCSTPPIHNKTGLSFTPLPLPARKKFTGEVPEAQLAKLILVRGMLLTPQVAAGFHSSHLVVSPLDLFSDVFLH